MTSDHLTIAVIVVVVSYAVIVAGCYAIDWYIWGRHEKSEHKEMK